MMLSLLAGAVVALYCLSVCGLMMYGFNCYVMTLLFSKKRESAEAARKKVLDAFNAGLYDGPLPLVTTQIPVYNEFNVAERVIRAACDMNYPEGRHEIQILDDSTDETRGLVDAVVSDLRAKERDVTVVRRDNRVGFKAGALAEGQRLARGELLAIFDADFVPPADYLLRAVPFFMADENVGLVQARWGHLNRRESMLTRAQSVGIDGHFMVEQSARNWSGLYMNFNGTAGVWRSRAILEGGGWHWDTLTEDMDLSYRVQFAGWRTVFLPDLIVPAEIPEDVSAFKSQQFRWAKGSIQTAKKLLPGIIRSRATLFKKIQAYFHLTHYMVHPLMLLLAVLALPMIAIVKSLNIPLPFPLIATILLLATIAPSTLYVISQRASHEDWRRRILVLPFLVAMGVGVAVSNARAVFEALIGHESGFVRTPKRGDKHIKRYKIRLPGSAVVEIALGLYCAWSFGYYLAAGRFLIGPFLAIYASGFLFIGMLTLIHAMGSARAVENSLESSKSRPPKSSGNVSTISNKNSK